MVEENRNSIDKRVCSVDPTHETYIKKNGKPDWRRDSLGQWICKRCYHQIINPIYNPKHTARNNARRITYKGKVVRVKEPPRIGVCNLCRAVVGEINTQTDELCKKTERDHYEYHDDDPLKDTLETCRSCHGDITWKRGQYTTEKMLADWEYRRNNMIITERNEKGQIVKYLYDSNKEKSEE